jgi:hypothetical protein
VLRATPPNAAAANFSLTAADNGKSRRRASMSEATLIRYKAITFKTAMFSLKNHTFPTIVIWTPTYHSKLT